MDTAEALARLAAILPLTTADTPHRLSVSGQASQAMCALDALAVAPMFDVDVTIDSVCEVAGDAVRILQQGRDVADARPSRDVHVGVQWQADGRVAAETL